MHLEDLLEHIHQSAHSTPPAPPIFDDPTLDTTWWSDRFGISSGAQVWQHLATRLDDTSRTEPLVTRDAWEDLLAAETSRRVRRLRDMEYTEDGDRRPEKERAAIRRAEWNICRTDFWHWLHNHGWIENTHAKDPELGLSPFLTWPGQLAYLWWFREAILEGRRTGQSVQRIVNKCRSAGVSWGCCHLIAYHFIFEKSFSAKVGGMTQREVDDRTTYSLLGKIKYVYEQQPEYLLPCYSFRYEVEEEAADFCRFALQNRENGAVVRGESITKRFGRSGREVVLFEDEFAHVEPSVQAASKAGRTSVAIAVWTVSTPNGRGNTFHTTFVNAHPQDCLTLPWTIDPRRDDAWYERLLVENGGDLTRDQRDQEYGCSFRGVKGLRIWTPPEFLPYDEGDREWRALAPRARAAWPVVCGMDFGDGPSPTVCRFALVDWAGGVESEEYGRLPRFWWDDEVYGYRNAPADIALRILETRGRYGGPWTVYGDPSGANPLVRDLPSWQTDLGVAGVPVVCLPSDPFAQRYFIDGALDLVQELMELGLWRVHADRCPITMQAEEQWQWDVPDGLVIEAINRASIKWKKDAWSHYCEAGWYGALAAILYHQPRPPRAAPVVPRRPQGLGGQLAGVFRRPVNPWR